MDNKTKYCTSCWRELDIAAETCECGARFSEPPAPPEKKSPRQVGSIDEQREVQAKKTKFCFTCGVAIDRKAEACPGCGARVMMPLTPQWKEITREEYIASIRRNYPPGEFNWWAAVLGPIYYGYKGVFKKGLVYFLLTLALIWTVILIIPLMFWMGDKFNREYLEHNGIYYVER